MGGLPPPLFLRPCTDIAVHYFCECRELYPRREKFWDLVSNNYEIELELELHNQPDEIFVIGRDIQYFSQAPNERMILICLSSYIRYPDYIKNHTYLQQVIN